MQVEIEGVGGSRSILEVEQMALADGFDMQDEEQKEEKGDSSVSNLTNQIYNFFSDGGKKTQEERECLKWKGWYLKP